MKHAFKMMIVLALFFAACSQSGNDEDPAEQAALETAATLDSLTTVLDETQEEIDSTIVELDSLLEGIEE